MIRAVVAAVDVVGLIVVGLIVVVLKNKSQRLSSGEIVVALFRKRYIRIHTCIIIIIKTSSHHRGS